MYTKKGVYNQFPYRHFHWHCFRQYSSY